MIINIAFRSGTKDYGTRDRALLECGSIAHDNPAITRIEIVFCKELHQASHQTFIQCHISLHVINRRQVDVYQSMATESMAFDAAFDRAITCLQRKTLTPSRVNKLQADELHLPIAL